MLELTYIAFIVIQFAIGPIIAFAPMATSVAWCLLALQVVAGVVQNIKFPCFAFRITTPALAISTLMLMYTPHFLTLASTML